MPTFAEVSAWIRSLSRHVSLQLAVRAGGERGQGMLEYALIGGIIIVGAVGALAAISGQLNRLFSQIASTLSQF